MNCRGNHRLRGGVCQLGGGYLRVVSSCSVSSWRVVIASNLATNPATLPLRMGGDRGRALQ